jgi:phospholipase/carboxylesterase
VEPRDAATAAVVWLHGLGADGHDFAPIVPVLRLPHARFVFPHAPAMPVTINGGFVMPAWYDIRSLDRAPDREDAEDIRVSAECIAELLEREIDRGIPAERIVLAGFSQGAAMALHVGLRHAETLAGLIILSGYRVLPNHFEAERSEANRRTPILFCHGLHDPLLPVELGREGHDFIKAQMPEADIRWHQFPIEHSVNEAEIEIVARWLAERFA